MLVICNDTQLDARNPSVIIRISLATSGFIYCCLDLIDFPNWKVLKGTLCNNVTIALTLKTLAILGVPRRLIYHRLDLRVSSGVSVWVRLLLGFRFDLTL